MFNIIHFSTIHLVGEFGFRDPPGIHHQPFINQVCSDLFQTLPALTRMLDGCYLNLQKAWLELD